MAILLYPLTGCTDTQAPVTSPQVPFASVPDLDSTPPRPNIPDDDVSALPPLATPTIDPLPPTTNSNSAGSNVSVPANFEPPVNAHLPPAFQSAITPSPEPVPDECDAGARPNIKPIFNFSSVASPQDRGWLQKAFRHLREAKLGPLWDETVNAFYEHEELMEFEVRLSFSNLLTTFADHEYLTG